MKKLKTMILLIIISFSFFLLLYHKKRSYTVKYDLNGYSIKETYKKNDERYIVDVDKNKKHYTFVLNEKYSKDRKLVDNIKMYKTDNEECMLISFNKKKELPKCKNESGYISYTLTSDKMKSKLPKYLFNKTIKEKHSTFNNIEITFLNNKKIFIWNYHGFYLINSNKNKVINIFDKDIYNPEHIGYIDKYIVMPNYNNDYEFTSLKILDTESLDINTFKLDSNLSEDSYVLGVNDKSIFFYDKKYEKEYEFVPYKLKIREVSPLIYDKGKKIDKSDVSLKNSNVKFIYDTIYEYKIINNNLYRLNKYNNDKELLSDLNIKEIVKSTDSEVYYISDDSLYVYSDKLGNKLMLKYFELSFNYHNLIYIF